MSARHSRAAWTAGLIAASVTTGVMTAAPAHAVVGDEAKDGQYAFTAKLDIGTGSSKRSCTGALVDQQWVLTAASCFADDPAQGYHIPAGAPKLKTTVTIGRTDLSGNGGTQMDAIDLAPRGDRDLVMVRLANRVTNVAPVTVGTGAPQQGEELRAAGYGRTADEWAPDLLHTAAFGVGNVSATGIDIDIDGKAPAGASLCKGDTGAPLFREKNGTFELAAVNSVSWQGGCFGSDDSEKRTGATGSRVDDVNTWIQQLRLAGRFSEITNVITTGNFSGSGRTDVAAVLKDGSLVAFYASPDGTLQYGRELWGDKSWGAKKQIVAGDFTGDGKTDIMAVGPDGMLKLYRGTDSGGLATGQNAWRDATWGKVTAVARFRADGWTRDGLLAQWEDGSLVAYPTGPDGLLTGQKREMWGDKSWHKRFIATGDFNGDGHDDIAAISPTGALQFYAGNGKGSFDDARDMWPDKSWGSMQFILGGDFDGDGKPGILARWGKGDLRWYPGDGKGTVGAARPSWPTAS
ncbi:trypsin-like serine protease [Streptomyces sp. NPDC001262]|uniref:trypsin-like serine protease n=1 Tax=Streptomyces sp. NPDC001262 TaxID=3364552 RepID=UPI0036C2E69A